MLSMPLERQGSFSQITRIDRVRRWRASSMQGKGCVCWYQMNMSAPFTMLKTPKNMLPYFPCIPSAITKSHNPCRCGLPPGYLLHVLLSTTCPSTLSALKTLGAHKTRHRRGWRRCGNQGRCSVHQWRRAIRGLHVRGAKSSASCCLLNHIAICHMTQRVKNNQVVLFAS